MKMKNIRIAYGPLPIGSAESGNWDVKTKLLTLDKTKWTAKALPDLPKLKGRKMNVKAEPVAVIGTRGQAPGDVETAPNLANGLVLESYTGQNGKTVLKQ
jgi:hypothetical protein